MAVTVMLRKPAWVTERPRRGNVSRRHEIAFVGDADL
jgi:hypothetical protein